MPVLDHVIREQLPHDTPQSFHLDTAAHKSSHALLVAPQSIDQLTVEATRPNSMESITRNLYLLQVLLVVEGRNWPTLLRHGSNSWPGHSTQIPNFSSRHESAIRTNLYFLLTMTSNALRTRRSRTLDFMDIWTESKLHKVFADWCILPCRLSLAAICLAIEDCSESA